MNELELMLASTQHGMHRGGYQTVSGSAAVPSQKRLEQRDYKPLKLVFAWCLKGLYRGMNAKPVASGRDGWEDSSGS